MRADVRTPASPYSFETAYSIRTKEPNAPQYIYQIIWILLGYPFRRGIGSNFARAHFKTEFFQLRPFHRIRPASKHFEYALKTRVLKTVFSRYVLFPQVRIDLFRPANDRVIDRLHILRPTFFEAIGAKLNDLAWSIESAINHVIERPCIAVLKRFGEHGIPA